MRGPLLDWRIRSAARHAIATIAGQIIRLGAARPGLVPIGRRATAWLERLVLHGPARELFDSIHYLRVNQDVSAAGLDAFEHYLADGWCEGRAPNARFDDVRYRAAAGISPGSLVSSLAHYVAIGRRRGLSPEPERQHRSDPGPLEVARVDPYSATVAGYADGDAPPRPSLSTVLLRLEQLAPLPHTDPIVDVLVPVYSGRAETLNTLVHILSTRQRTPFELVVIADAPPDPKLRSDLRRLARRGLLTLVENDRNLGFPASMNLGMALHPMRDVVWLNADTEVYADWLDRLRRTALQEPDVATVTPLTNNGTICSYPIADRDNPHNLALGWDEIDAMAARVNRGVAVEAPTCVGFATYVRRAAIHAIGVFDAETFGRGYGEENDFSQRAKAAGFRNLIAADVFIRHFGATSFREESADRIAHAIATLGKLHPGYCQAVTAFQAANPLAEARARIDLARLMDRRARPILIVTHSLGGGTAQHVQGEIARLEGKGHEVFLLTRGETGSGSARLARAGDGPIPTFANLPWAGEQLWSLMAKIGFERVDLHHLIDFPSTAASVFREKLAALSIPYRVIVHDYFAICPRINLADQRGRYCGEPAPNACRRCLIAHGSPVGRVGIGRWREQFHALVEGAGEVVAPDVDVAQRLSQHWHDVPVTVRPHDDSRVGSPLNALPRPGPLRIAVIGAIGPIKGIDAVLGLARALEPSDAELTVIGYTHDDQTARRAGISVTGPYLNADVQRRIAEVDPDVIWIPSLWPETYCYTLSIAFASGRPVAAFDLGAQATRIRAAGHGTLIPLEEAFDPETLFRRLCAAARPVLAQEEHPTRSAIPTNRSKMPKGIPA